MSHIAAHDLRLILEAIEELNSSIERASLSRTTSAAVLRLFPESLTAFDVFTQEEHVEQSWSSDPARLTPAVMQVFHDVWNENPFENPLTEKLLTGTYPGALKVSDFASRSEMQRTAIYNEFYRHVGIEHMLGLGIKIAPGTNMSCAVGRTSKDFSERDRELLTLLSPHIRNAIRNTIAFEKMSERAAVFESLLSERSRGLIYFTVDGVIVDSTPVAQQLFDKYFCGSGDPQRLPEVLRNWARDADNSLAGAGVVEPLRVFLDDGSLSIDFVRGETPGLRILILEEHRDLNPASLQILGLTRREAEVLYWIEKGKTDDVIATLLGISVRTVNKHVENLLRKLNVETRTAAVNAIMSSVNGRTS